MGGLKLDASKTFIKMCEKAIKIQESKNILLPGDIIQIKKSLSDNHKTYDIICIGEPIQTQRHKNNLHILYEGYDDYYSFYREFFTWLPRQDQLQDMIKQDIDSQGIITRKTGYWYTKELTKWFDTYSYPNTTIFIDATPEQAWLMFVMHREYNKVWDGEDWVMIK